MIKSVQIKNFQICKNLKLDFVPGINVICGNSDNGKSAIIRSLRWFFENRPSGHKFKTKGSGPAAVTTVEVSFENESIIRAKSKTRNEYIHRGVSFKALGTSVPDEIMEITNIDDINIQRQFDKHFVLQYTDSDVSDMVSELAGIGEVGQVLDEANKRFRTAKQEESFLVGMIDEQEIELQKIIKFYNARPAVEKVKNRMEKLERKKKELEDMKKILFSLRDLSRQSIPSTTMKTIIAKAEECKEKQEYLEHLQEEQMSLRYHLQKIKELRDKKFPDLAGILSKTKSLREKTKSLDSQKDSAESLRRMVSAVQEVNKNLLEITESLEEAETLLHKIKKELGICPICKSPF